ncbi:diphosphomevalonate decarboxylase [Candidatus Beckwithbacteria bacterium CG22_combo_CG10-13_8_21_14_all_01_47_9]|uniref:diphosphomevalonate decarboxylase n=3 Tax=Candidatus Beckwithiibacteriota TaxID=1752726 RepID=A0A2H0E0L2_9BACT|nr:MAG: diphosphomevalonate decarboxylase [Candidatus Beckwithbacteria bacterium CG1_02_47_37]PIP87678.1 MAG: diphosphomevalonate decarboxylase [Candidatus Beckwithbacteria bacterium CG22_combo_CG10-13_8_21_14_all_01_47_9]PJA22393.1 MAG: diphosphomevalonate decarboxylase [Candidatus Beckwithbacteria bacterium CG_4_10_14_0_2_um_filter_47_25]
MKATAFAPVNVALIKYWGKVDEKLRLPANASLSVNLTKLGTTTTVEWAKNSEPKIITENNFPMSVGLSSSASGYAAMTVAMAAAAGLKLSQKDLSRLARLGSGSACRSIPDGWAEWVTGNDQTSYAKTIFPADYWDLRILVVILSDKKKSVSSTAGQELAATSPFYQARIKGINSKISRIKSAIKEKNFTVIGEIMEEDCLNMHRVMQTQSPPLNYLLPATKTVIRSVRKWRDEGLENYFTINTGQNVFVFCEPKNENKLIDKLSHTGCVIKVRRDKIGRGARLV